MDNLSLRGQPVRVELGRWPGEVIVHPVKRRTEEMLDLPGW